MKIAVLAEYHRLSPRVENEIDTLTNVGHCFKVFHLTRCTPEQICSLSSDGENTKIEHEYIYLRAPLGTYLLSVYIPLLYFKLWLALRRQRFDVIHFTHLLFLPFAVLWGRTHQARLIYDAYEFHVVDLAMKAPYRFAKLYNLLELLEDKLVSRVDAVLTIDSVNNTLVDRYQRLIKNVEVLYNVPKLAMKQDERAENKHENLPNKEQIIVYVGGLSRIKGIMKAIEAINLVRNSIPEVKLVLIGSFLDGSEEECQAYVERQRIESNIEFTNWLPFDKMLHYMICSKVGLVLHQPTPRFWLVSRGNGRKFFSYMQASLPIIGPEFGEVAQVVRDENCGILCNTTNPKEIADAIIYLLKHPQEAKAMGKRGRIAVEQKYNWDVEKEKLLRIYRKLGVSINEQSASA